AGPTPIFPSTTLFRSVEMFHFDSFYKARGHPSVVSCPDMSSPMPPSLPPQNPAAPVKKTSPLVWILGGELGGIGLDISGHDTTRSEEHTSEIQSRGHI